MEEVAVIYNTDKNEVVGVHETYIGALKWGLKYITSGEVTLEDFAITCPYDEIDWSNDRIQRIAKFAMEDEDMKVEMFPVDD